MRTALPRRPSGRRLALESLENRLLLSGLQVTRVVVDTSPAQGSLPSSDGGFAPPPAAVASDARGDFVVVWASTPNSSDILARRYSAAGVPLGPVITVVSGISPPGFQPDISVAMDSSGEFVVAFDAFNGTGVAVFALRFDAAGNPVDATPFQVSAGIDEFDPAVAMDDQGRFAIAYAAQESSTNDVLVQYGSDSAANPLVGGPTTLASVPLSAFTSYASLSAAADSAGDVAVAFEADQFPGSSVYLSRFTMGAAKVAAPTLVASGSAVEPAVAVDRSTGEALFTWTFASAMPSVQAQLFDLSGNPVGPQLQVNPSGVPAGTSGYDGSHAAFEPGGGFVVVWSSHASATPGLVVPNNPGGSAPLGDVFASRYDAAGNPLGGPLTVNTSSDAPGTNGVAADGAAFVAVYTTALETTQVSGSPMANGTDFDVIAAVFSAPPGTPPPPGAPPSPQQPSPASFPTSLDHQTAIALFAGQEAGRQQHPPPPPPPPPRQLPIDPRLRGGPFAVELQGAVPSFDRARAEALRLIFQVGGGSAVGEISGRLFADMSGSGVYDEGKPGLPGRIVFLDLNRNGALDEGEPTAVTDARGDYAFHGLAMQTYQVRTLLTGDDVQTLPANNDAYVVGLSATRPDVGERDFGITTAPRRAAPRLVAPPAPAAAPPTAGGSDTGGPEEEED